MAYDTIDPRAQVQATQSRTIPAPIDRVWAVLADVSGWRESFAHVHAGSLTDPFAPGATFRWRSYATVHTTTLRVVTPPSRLVWTDQSGGAQQVAVWDLAAQGDATQVTLAQSERGWRAMVFPAPQRRALDAALTQWLDGLQRAVVG